MLPVEKTSTDDDLLQSLLDACRREYARSWDGYTQLERKSVAVGGIATALLVTTFILDPLGHGGHSYAAFHFCMGFAKVLSILSLFFLLFGIAIRAVGSSAFPEQLDRLMEGLGPTATPELAAAARATFLQDRINSFKQALIELREVTDRKSGLITLGQGLLIGATSFIALAWFVMAIT